MLWLVPHETTKYCVFSLDKYRAVGYNINVLTSSTQAALHGTVTSFLEDDIAYPPQILSACKYDKEPYCIRRLLRLLSGMSQVRVLSALTRCSSVGESA